MRYLAIILPLLLAACAQDYGGITKLDYNPETGEISYVGGKEFGSLEAEVDKQPDGTYKVRVNVGEVAAFQGQAIQAQRIAEQTAVISSVMQAMLPSIIQTSLCAAGIVTACAPPVNPGTSP